MDKTASSAAGQRELSILRTTLFLYISLALLTAGLNYGLAGRVSEQNAALMQQVWHIYENWIKTLVIMLCGVLTLRIRSRRQRTVMRKGNIIGFTAAALVIHIIAPLLLNNPEIYLFAMPLPWNSLPLQAGIEQSAFHREHLRLWGAAGITWALIFFWGMTLIVGSGTVIAGRRWQCSTLCLFNGFAAEVFAPAVPLITFKRRKNRRALYSRHRLLNLFRYIRWAFFMLAWLLILFWLLIPEQMLPGRLTEAIRSFETWKYLLFELLMMMFFWAAFIGRGYCLYCPLGTTLALISRVAGQRIQTDLSTCISCGRCSRVCPVGIDVEAFARGGRAVQDLRCLGCGHCVDICPTETLAYRTKILDLFSGEHR